MATLADQFMEDLETAADDDEQGQIAQSNETQSPQSSAPQKQPQPQPQPQPEGVDSGAKSSDDDEKNDDIDNNNNNNNNDTSKKRQLKDEMDLEEDMDSSAADLNAAANLAKQSGVMESDDYVRRLGDLLNPDVNLADRFRDVQALTRVLSSTRLLKHLQSISPLLEDDSNEQKHHDLSSSSSSSSPSPSPSSGAQVQSNKEQLQRIHFEDHPEYELVVQSNKLVTEIDDEISVLHKYLRDLYSRRFPELEQYVVNPLDYARVVKQIGSEHDIPNVNLRDLLPNSVLMIVTVTGATTQGQPFQTDAELNRVLATADAILSLDEAKSRILRYIQSRMDLVAPNLTAVTGSAVAANLIGTAGGLSKLSTLPASIIQLLGTKVNIASGLSSTLGSQLNLQRGKTKPGEDASQQGSQNTEAVPIWGISARHVGFIGTCPLVRSCPPLLRKRVARLIAAKCALAARCDAYCNSANGSEGQQLAALIESRIKKWQEPPAPKQEKPLPAPDDKPRKRRGGKRVRRLKNMFRNTEIRKLTNRLEFGRAEAETIEGKGLGMLGTDSGRGRLRLQVDTRIKAKKLDKLKGVHSHGGTTSSLTAPSGLSSSLAFTPIQGFELVNPEEAKQRQLAAQRQDKYFSSSKGFLKIGGGGTDSAVPGQKREMPPPPPSSSPMPAPPAKRPKTNMSSQPSQPSQPSQQ